MSNKVPVNKCQKTNAYRDRGDFHAISTADALCGSHACQKKKKLSACFLIGSVHPFKNSFYLNHLTGRRPLLMVLSPPCHWLCLNTPKSLRWASTSCPWLAQSLVHMQTMQGHVKTLVYSDHGNDLQVPQQQTENTCQEIQEESFKENTPPMRRRVEMPGNCCRDNIKITHIPASTGPWTFTKWDFFAQNEYYTPCKNVIFFFFQHPV